MEIKIKYLKAFFLFILACCVAVIITALAQLFIQDIHFFVIGLMIVIIPLFTMWFGSEYKIVRRE